MSCLRRFVLIAVLPPLFLIVWSGRVSFAESTPNAHPAPPAKAAEDKKKPKPEPKAPAPRHFLEVFRLNASAQISPAVGSCFPGPLQFPATNAAAVAKLLASEADFTLEAIPPDKIAVFHKSAIPPPAALLALEQHMIALASSEFSKVTAVRVTSGSTEKSIAQFTPPDGDIVVKAVGPDCLLIVSKSQADPVTVIALAKSLRELYWRQPSVAATQRLFYLDATAVAKKLSGSGDSGGDKGGTDAGTPEKSRDPSPSKGDGPGGKPAPAAAKNGAPAGSSGAGKAKGKGADDGTSDASEQPEESAGSDKSKNKPAPAPPPKPPTMQPVNDMLVYSNEDGTDRGIFERNRLMAVLDLPRPEVLMNIWSLQASSGDPKTVTSEAEAARQLIAHHNDLLQQAIDRGWASLSSQMTTASFFDKLFYGYVTQKFGQTDADLADLQRSVSAQDMGKKGELELSVDSARRRWGWCKKNQYCLGFSHAFEPLRPTFTNLLIGMIAAKDPNGVAETVVQGMEGSQPAPSNSSTVCEGDPSGGKEPCADQDGVKAFHACIQKTDRQLHTFKAQSSDCALNDRIALSEQLLNDQEESLQLNCFREQTKVSFSQSGENRATTRAGLLRAAVADFLFNYKWATQYPHDFIPYDLTQSAQELNAEFNPLVLAFNRDVAAFTENLQAELECKYQANIRRTESRNWFGRDDRTFMNDGMLSVRGISGVESLVDTVTQSFFDATNPPTLTDLVKSVSDAEKNLPGVLKANLSANEAAVLMGALNSVQPAEAKIGRELKLDITPHALAGASSAELEVKLTAEEAGSPTRFTADKSADDNLSRIAKHDVSTRVRVESLKLFEVSAFSAMLQRARSKFPIVPPLFEVPYFGSFIGWPLSGAKVYHRSTAIVSAVIVPTAADVAFGIDFGADRLCDENGCHRAKSPRDFGPLPLRNFHKVMIQCLASGGVSPYTGLLEAGVRDLSHTECENLTLFEAGRAAQRTTVPPSD